MADSRVRKRPKKTREDGNQEKPTKEEIAVAKHLRFQLPTKKTTFMHENVEYFTGTKAVDFLLDSKWATSKKGTDPLFTTRASVIAYMNRLLQKRMFYRTIKTVKRKRDKDAKSKDKEIKEKDSKQGDKETKKKDKEKDTKSKDKETKKKDIEADEKKVKKQEKKKEEQNKEEEEENETTDKDAKKGKKKVVLDFADIQCFKDNLDAYVWVYDPIKPSHYILGFSLVIAAIGICIYPLWPPEIKIGTYYLSLVGAGFVGSILVLGVFRFILFTILWAVTLGKLHFWLFPNLLEDVGVQESFQPIYTKEWRGSDKKGDQIDDKDKKNEEDEDRKEEDENETQEENDEEKASDSKNEDDDEKSESGSEENNESENEGEENREAGENGEGADFEVIEKEEISAVEE